MQAGLIKHLNGREDGEFDLVRQFVLDCARRRVPLSQQRPIVGIDAEWSEETSQIARGRHHPATHIFTDLWVLDMENEFAFTVEDDFDWEMTRAQFESCEAEDSALAVDLDCVHVRLEPLDHPAAEQEIHEHRVTICKRAHASRASTRRLAPLAGV